MKAPPLGYKKAKQCAKEAYSRIGRVLSPALGGVFVAFTSEGFNHLVRKGRIPRPRNEQKRRFALVQFLEQIVKNPGAVIVYRQTEEKREVDRHGTKVLVTSVAHFWTFIEKIEDCTVKVVIRRLGDTGQSHFLSVMGDCIEL